MSGRPKAQCDEAMRWLKARGWDLAPLTGQDARALRAIAHVWEMYFASDRDGRRSAIDAAAALLDGCQEVCWPMARELIAQAGDWSHRAELWPEVVLAFHRRRAIDGKATIDLRGDERSCRLLQCHEGLPIVEGQGHG